MGGRRLLHGHRQQKKSSPSTACTRRWPASLTRPLHSPCTWWATRRSSPRGGPHVHRPDASASARPLTPRDARDPRQRPDARQPRAWRACHAPLRRALRDHPRPFRSALRPPPLLLTSCGAPTSSRRPSPIPRSSSASRPRRSPRPPTRPWTGRSNQRYSTSSRGRRPAAHARPHRPHALRHRHRPATGPHPHRHARVVSPSPTPRRATPTTAGAPPTIPPARRHRLHRPATTISSINSLDTIARLRPRP